jgi:FtsP/CotA-like multicopper oxidase with cupredoxin domain
MTNRRRFLSLLPLSGMASRALAAAPTEPGREPDVELELTAAPAEIPILPGNPTKVWRFTGKVIKGPASSLQSLPNSYLGPVLRLRRGQHVRIRFRNNLGEPSIIHWHGLDIPENADGHPRFAIGQNQEFVSNFTVINRAGTYWYHPHPHMRTAPQVYKGLAGLVIVSRSGCGPNALRDGIHDAGWQDTVLVLPGEKVRVQIRFSSLPGLYLYHCHILEHEDMGMMRNSRITPPAAN